MLVCGERGYGDGSTPYSWLSNIALLPWLPGFPPQAFPTTNSSLTSTWSIYPQSTAALTLGLLYNPQTPAPSHCAFQETCVPVWGMYGCGKDCLVLIPFKLPQISCFTLSLKRFSSESDNCPDVGTGLLLWFPHPPKAGPIQSNPPIFPTSSFILLSVAWSYIFFSTGQVLLSTLSWCSAWFLCLKMCSWCIPGDRCTPHPPTPPPSCSPNKDFFFKAINLQQWNE